MSELKEASVADACLFSVRWLALSSPSLELAAQQICEGFAAADDVHGSALH